MHDLSMLHLAFEKDRRTNFAFANTNVGRFQIGLIKLFMEIVVQHPEFRSSIKRFGNFLLL